MYDRVAVSASKLIDMTRKAYKNKNPVCYPGLSKFCDTPIVAQRSHNVNHKKQESHQFGGLRDSYVVSLYYNRLTIAIPRAIFHRLFHIVFHNPTMTAIPSQICYNRFNGGALES